MGQAKRGRVALYQLSCGCVLSTSALLSALAWHVGALHMKRSSTHKRLNHATPQTSKHIEKHDPSRHLMLTQLCVSTAGPGLNEERKSPMILLPLLNDLQTSSGSAPPFLALVAQKGMRKFVAEQSADGPLALL